MVQLYSVTGLPKLHSVSHQLSAPFWQMIVVLYSCDLWTSGLDYSKEQWVASCCIKFLLFHMCGHVVMSRIAKPIMRQLSARDIYYRYLYFTHWLIIVSLSKFVSYFPMPCWFTVKILWDIQSLQNSISQKFHKYKASHSRDVQVRHKSILFYYKIICTQIHGLPS